jgi:hypothetical protein
MVIALNKLTATTPRRKLPEIESEIEDIEPDEEIVIKPQPKPNVKPNVKPQNTNFKKKYSDSDKINEGKL